MTCEDEDWEVLTLAKACYLLERASEVMKAVESRESEELIMTIQTFLRMVKDANSDS